MIAGVGSLRALGWAVATVVGLVIGGFALHFPGSTSSMFDPVALVFGTLFGGLNGLAVGLLQWAALWRAIDRGARRAWTMGVIFGGTHGAYDGLPAMGILLPLGAGVFAGLVVWGMLGERRPGMLLGVAGGWATGLLAGAATTRALQLPASETPIGWATEHAVVGLVTGLVFGGAVLLANHSVTRQPARSVAR